jgi:hypothetical protein
VRRGFHGTPPAAYGPGETVYELSKKAVTVPFPRDFFGSPYSGIWSYPVSLPDVRVASGELFVTNDLGNSETREVAVTGYDSGGFRTRAGGQYSIQVDGYLAVDESVAAPLVVESSHAVRDVFAILGRPADRPVQLRVNVDSAHYCTLTFATGAIVSDSVDGFALPPLRAGSRVTVSVLTVGLVNPGGDLTVLIRL